MNEDKKVFAFFIAKLCMFIVAVIFIASVALIIIGQKNIGPQGLLTMLAGLAGLIGLLAFYNHKYK